MLNLWPHGKQRLNREQHDSLLTAIRHKFQLIQGPPGSYTGHYSCIVCVRYIITGTGKSVTGAHLAYAFIVAKNPNLRFVPPYCTDEKIKCVMYCGPSNKSVDVALGMFIDIAKKLAGMFKQINRARPCLPLIHDYPYRVVLASESKVENLLYGILLLYYTF